MWCTQNRFDEFNCSQNVKVGLYKTSFTFAFLKYIKWFPQHGCHEFCCPTDVNAGLCKTSFTFAQP